MEKNTWVEEFAGSVVVCDPEGIILEMNEKAVKTFQKSGGAELIGSNLLDCHPEPSRSKLIELMEQRRTNMYTIEKNGVKKFIYQSPWYLKGEYRGFLEMVLEVPAILPHFIRDAS
ncbi:MAG: diguanylate cyclase [Thermodesulfovibrio sp.]|nr:diguanylate cyclase [Thermodesulfovibrio sp.]